MMAKIWLGAVLGILLGLTVIYTSGAPVVSPANMKLPMVSSQAQPTSTEMARPVRSGSELLLVSLLVGIVVAVPFFVAARRRM